MSHRAAAAAGDGFTPATASTFDPKRGKKRGSYNCGRCGQPKKGHSCNTDGVAAATTPTGSSVSPAVAAARPPPSRQSYSQSHLRRALSFDDDVDAEAADDSPELGPELEPGTGGFEGALWEVLRRLPPAGLLAAANVCKGWRETTRRVWRAAEELRVRVPVRSPLGFVGSVLQKCSNLVGLYLQTESDVDVTMLACIAFSCPNIECMEISTSETAVNRITGDELGRFVADRRCLTTLKMEGCSNFGSFNLCSSSLSTLWLSGLRSSSKMVFNCPGLKEISLEFSHQEHDNTDLSSMVHGLGRTCPRLQNIHIASVRLSHSAVLALTAANLRGLRMLSLVFGTGITDASVAAIASSYSNLEFLDLSGSSISDSGIGMICNVFPDTLSRLLLASCPNITSSGIQFATAQLPFLQLMDCGMTISDPNSEDLTFEESSNSELQRTTNNKLHRVYQKLIIKHNRLKKLSLWGCSGLDSLYLNCPKLEDLNLNSCNNLYPERLLLQCPSLERVHASGCQELLLGAIQSQVRDDFADVENQFPSKRLADGSKRVRVPQFLYEQPTVENRKRKRVERRLCNVLVD